MMSVMPPSDHHRFYLTDSATFVELHWRTPSPEPARSLLGRVLSFLSGSRPDPRQVVDHKAFDRAAAALATDPDAAFAAFTRLGYEVSIQAPEYRAAA